MQDRPRRTPCRRQMLRGGRLGAQRHQSLHRAHRSARGPHPQARGQRQPVQPAWLRRAALAGRLPQRPALLGRRRRRGRPPRGLGPDRRARRGPEGPRRRWWTGWRSSSRENERIVVKDPRLAWFFELHRVAAAKVGADIHVATMLRHPAEVMRSREIAYGTRTDNTTRVIGWMTMMLGIEARTRDLPRATVRYDDLLDDWRAALAQADSILDMGLFERATAAQVADAGDLVDPTLRRSVADWDELGLPAAGPRPRARTYDAYGRLVGAPCGRAGPDPGRARRPPRGAHRLLRRVLRRRPHPRRRLRPSRAAQGRPHECARRCARQLPSARVRAPAATSCSGRLRRARRDRDSEPARGTARRRPPRRRGRHPRRARHPQAADQDRRQDDPRAHPGGLAGAPDGRRDHRDDGPRSPRRGARDRAQRRLRQGHPDPRGRRHPQRHHPAGARRTSPTTARCSSTTRCDRWSASGSSPSASRRSSTYDAVDVAIPSADTIIEVDPDDNTIRAIPQRSNLRRGQTPQAFRASVLRAAYE